MTVKELQELLVGAMYEEKVTPESEVAIQTDRGFVLAKSVSLLKVHEAMQDDKCSRVFVIRS
jgi:hypothetical protein